MNPTPEAIAAIRAYVTDWRPSDATIAAALNTPDRPNPTPQGQVPKPMSTTDLLGKVGNAGKGKIYRGPAIVGIQADIRAGNRDAAKNWFGLAAAAGDVSAAENDALTAEIDATIPDPNWQPLVSWAQATLGRAVDADDIAAARPEG
jgi:hypothetical protein